MTGGDGSFLGGLVAYNVGIPELAQGSISQSYATGAVTGGAAGAVGGLVALNFGTLDQTYAAGRVSGGPGSTTGGLVAANNFNSPQEVLNAINIPEFSVAPGTATNSYWDTQTTGQDTSAGGSPMTSAQLGSGLPPGFDPAVWRSASGSYPFLTGQPDPLPVPGEPVPRKSPPACTTGQGPGCPATAAAAGSGQHRASCHRRTSSQAWSTSTPQGSAEGAGSDQHAKQRRNRQRLRRLGRLRQGNAGGNGGRPPTDFVPPAGLGPLPSGMPPLNETRFPNNEVVMQLGLRHVAHAGRRARTRSIGLEIIYERDLRTARPHGLPLPYHWRRNRAWPIARAAARRLHLRAAELPVRDGAKPSSRPRADTQPRATGAIHRQQARLPEAHGIATGKDVKVAVIDSEIDGSIPTCRA